MTPADLLAAAGVTEVCELRSARVGFLALHGGLEAATYEIAAGAAQRCGASLYAVVQPAGLQCHVPSHRHGAGASRALDEFCAHVDLAISIHGYGGLKSSDARWTTIVLGGSRRDVADELAARLARALPEYEWIADIDRIPPEYRGLHADNPVNRTRGGGVQIELPPRVRGTSPQWADAPRDTDGFVAHTAILVRTLAEMAVNPPL